RLRRAWSLLSAVGTATELYARDVAAYAAKRNRNRLVKPAGSGTHDIAGIGRDFLWHASILVGNADGGVIIRRHGARLERFQDGAAALARTGARAALGIDANQPDAGGNLERGRRLVGERELHEIFDDRSGGMASLRRPAQTAGLVVAKIETDDEIRRKADEPDVFSVTGGAGFAGNRLADLAHDRRRAALHHPLRHRGDLIGRHRIEHLLPAIDELGLGLILPAARRVAAATLARIMFENRTSVAVLDAVDQGRLHPPAAIGEHRIRRDHPHD